MSENEISYLVRSCAYKVHSHLGCGLLESVYEAAMCYELRASGLRVRSQVGVPMDYKGIKVEVGFRLDILVEDTVIIEIKSVEYLAKLHHKQLLTYLRLTGKKLGLLINFNATGLIDKESLVRIANFY